MSKDESAHTSIYLPRTLLVALRQKLIGEGKSLSQWAREQAEAYTKSKK